MTYFVYLVTLCFRKSFLYATIYAYSTPILRLFYASGGLPSSSSRGHFFGAVRGSIWFPVGSSPLAPGMAGAFSLYA